MPSCAQVRLTRPTHDRARRRHDNNRPAMQVFGRYSHCRQPAVGLMAGRAQQFGEVQPPAGVIVPGAQNPGQSATDAAGTGLGE